MLLFWKEGGQSNKSLPWEPVPRSSSTGHPDFTLDSKMQQYIIIFSPQMS